jgi:hypothetical protein
MYLEKLVAGLIVEFYTISEAVACVFSNTGTLQNTTRSVDARSAKFLIFWVICNFNFALRSLRGRHAALQ